MRSDRRCADQIFVMRQLCEKMKEDKNVAFLAFMDLEKAYKSGQRGHMTSSGDLWRKGKVLGGIEL